MSASERAKVNRIAQAMAQAERERLANRTTDERAWDARFALHDAAWADDDALGAADVNDARDLARVRETADVLLTASLEWVAAMGANQCPEHIAELATRVRAILEAWETQAKHMQAHRDETERIYVMVRALQTMPNAGEFMTADYDPTCHCGEIDEPHFDSGAALVRCGLHTAAHFPTVKGAALIAAALDGGYIDAAGNMTDAGRARVHGGHAHDGGGASC